MIDNIAEIREPWGVKRVRVCGVGVDSITRKDTLDIIDRMVASGKGNSVSFLDGNLCSHALINPSMVALLDKDSLVLPDGAALMVGARLLGEPLAQRLVGPDVMLAYCRHSAPLGRKHFFYGGAEGVAELLRDKLVEQVPDLQVVGTFCPPFRPLSDAEEADVKQRIEKSSAEVVWVGLGAPKQNIWMAEHVNKINVPLMLGVGAAFDYLSGRINRAPRWAQKSGWNGCIGC